MDYTARMMRRTLLCAVFACALAPVSLPAAFALQAVITLGFALCAGECPPLWPRPPQGFSARGGRAIYCLCLGLALGALLYTGALTLKPTGGALRIVRALCALSAHLLQCTLLGRVKRAGHKRLAACLIALAVVIGCTR